MYEDFSEALSMVTECVYDVADQDTYALFHTQAFEIADAITSDDNVESVLNNAYTFLSDNGVDTDDVKTCMENSNTDEMSVDWDDAIAIGIGGTPAFVVGKLNDDGTVDGVLISDAQAYSKFQEVIDSYL
jgi:protein-disulfide isomerase